MTELAYMVREDWAQRGTAMAPQSTVIRDWIGEAPHLFAVTDVKKFSHNDRGADFAAAEYIAPDTADRVVFNIGKLSGLEREDTVIHHAVVVLHPFEQRELETIRRTVEAGSADKMFILIWSRYDMVRTWLDGVGALDLHTGESVKPPDPLMLHAAKMLHDEDYNGLASGYGKDAVVQIVRSFASEGYPVDVASWLRAYFAVGGTFRHAESIEKLIKEMNAGTHHRVKPYYRGNIVEIVREQVATRP